MTVYLPIAGLSVNALALLLVGCGAGLVSGLFGVGGGFLLTPLLIFLGIPSPVAVATGANQVLGASVSGVIAHWRRRNVDLRMGMVLVMGGIVGAALGVSLLSWLHKKGQVDLAINLVFVLFLGFVGISMLQESVRSLLTGGESVASRQARGRLWSRMPLKMHFPRSGLQISALLPAVVGVLGGLLSAIMGGGGGFLMVPLMIYVIGMPTSVVVGTSLFQIVAVTAGVTFMQAVQSQTVDVVLMMPLLVGGVVGAQIGARFSTHMRAEQTRLVLALLVLGVCARLLLTLMEHPADLYSLAGPLAG